MAARWKTETDAERLESKTKASSMLQAQSSKNVFLPRSTKNTGSHIMVMIKSAMAKLHRRKFEPRRSFGLVRTAAQTSMFPIVPSKLTKALIAMRAVP